MIAELNKIIDVMHRTGVLTALSFKWYHADMTKKIGKGMASE